MIEIADLQMQRLGVPLAAPVQLAFGRLRERTALLLTLTSREGHVGRGEVFANWPPGGAAHREHLLREVFAPLLVGRGFASPQEMFEALARATHRLRLQCDEPGPFDQCLAGLDLAAWQLHAQARGQPVAALLAAPRAPAAAVPIYVSGVMPARAEATLTDWWASGCRRFKLMIGADWRAALPVFERLRERHGDALTLMADANQAFERAEALEALRELRRFDLAWLEEPLAADAPLDDWRALVDAGLPLAAGENLRGERQFAAMLDAGVLSVLQPDVIKWGGFSGLVPIAREALRRGLRLCPHYLGGPVGWRASAQLLAAVGGDGWLETDANGHLLAAAAGLPAALDIVRDGLVPLDSADAGGVQRPPQV